MEAGADVLSLDVDEGVDQYVVPAQAWPKHCKKKKPFGSHQRDYIYIYIYT